MIEIYFEVIEGICKVRSGEGKGKQRRRINFGSKVLFFYCKLGNSNMLKTNVLLLLIINLKSCNGTIQLVFHVTITTSLVT